VSRPYQAEKIQPGGGQVERKKKCATLCIPLNTHSWWRGLARAWQTNDMKWQTLRKHLSTTWC